MQSLQEVLAAQAKLQSKINKLLAEQRDLSNQTKILNSSFKSLTSRRTPVKIELMGRAHAMAQIGRNWTFKKGQTSTPKTAGQEDEIKVTSLLLSKENAIKKWKEIKQKEIRSPDTRNKRKLADMTGQVCEKAKSEDEKENAPDAKESPSKKRKIRLDQMTPDQLMSINSIKVKVFSCDYCKTRSEDASVNCVQKGHYPKGIMMEKRAFQCSTCKTIAYIYGDESPDVDCQRHFCRRKGGEYHQVPVFTGVKNVKRYQYSEEFVNVKPLPAIPHTAGAYRTFFNPA